MKSVLRHPLLVIAILVAICLTIIIPLTLSRSAGPIQLGDNRTAERDRLAKEYGVSKETANQIMVDLERQTGKRILNSVDLPDGAALGTGEIDGVAWRLRAAPYPLAKPPQGLWVPQAVRLEVAAPGGGTLTLDTVALRPLSGP